MPDPDRAVILLRFSGEIATKAKPTRTRFEARLLRNVRDALRTCGCAARVSRTRNRVFIDTGDLRVAETLSRVFGVQSLAVATVHPAEKQDELVRAAYEQFRGAVVGKRFAVRARRVGDRSKIGFDSRAIEHALGAALLRHAARVDLDDPEVVVSIELHESCAYLCAEQWRGPAGLPLGIEGGAIALLSGGFDSAVAAWQMLRRGVRLDYLFCNLGGSAHEKGALRVARLLAERWSYGDFPQLYAIDFAAVATEIRAKTTSRYWQLMLKRQMLRAAEAVAAKRRAAALVTGDAVGQVSSQTLSNLAAISQATALPILRPLVGVNKDEIIRLAEQIGTAPLSTGVAEYCSMAATRPATSSHAHILEAEEALLDPAILEDAIENRGVFDLRALELDSPGIAELDVEAIADDAIVIDLRSRSAFAAWHWPGALQLDFDRALLAHSSFARDQRYVLYCEFGLKSAHLAERMRQRGFDASSFRGGLRGVTALAHTRNPRSPEPFW